MWKVYLRFQRDAQTAVIGDKTLQMKSQTFISIRGILYICRLVTMITHDASVTELRLICSVAGRLWERLASSVGSSHEILENCVNALLVPTVKPRFLFECRAISPVLNLELPIETFSSTYWEVGSDVLVHFPRTPKWQPHVLNKYMRWMFHVLELHAFVVCSPIVRTIWHLCISAAQSSSW